MNRQQKKYSLSLAGEYFVAAELKRHQISASITYGNAKNADVIAVSENGKKVVVIEIKSTSNEKKWVVGGKLPERSNKPWVFVFIPEDKTKHPSYYVLTQTELHDLVAPVGIEYGKRYKEKHGVEYGDKPGVISLFKNQVEAHKGAWNKIIELLNEP